MLRLRFGPFHVRNFAGGLPVVRVRCRSVVAMRLPNEILSPTGMGRAGQFGVRVGDSLASSRTWPRRVWTRDAFASSNWSRIRKLHPCPHTPLRLLGRVPASETKSEYTHLPAHLRKAPHKPYCTYHPQLLYLS